MPLTNQSVSVNCCWLCPVRWFLVPRSTGRMNMYIVWGLNSPRVDSSLDSGSQSQSQSYFTNWRFTANHFFFESSPLRPTTRVFLLNPRGNSPSVTSSLTRRYFCLFWICLFFHQVYVSHILHVIQKISFCTIQKFSVSTQPWGGPHSKHRLPLFVHCCVRNCCYGHATVIDRCVATNARTIAPSRVYRAMTYQ
jgi:hypothetical protein